MRHLGVVIILSEIGYRSPARPCWAASTIASAASTADRLEFDTAQDERQLAECRTGDDRAVRCTPPVAGTVGGRHAHRHRGESVVSRRFQHQLFGLRVPDVGCQTLSTMTSSSVATLFAAASDGGVGAGVRRSS